MCDISSFYSRLFVLGARVDPHPLEDLLVLFACSWSARKLFTLAPVVLLLRGNFEVPVCGRVTLFAASAPRVFVTFPGRSCPFPAAGPFAFPAAAQRPQTRRKHRRSLAGTACATASRRSRGRSAQPPAGDARAAPARTAPPPAPARAPSAGSRPPRRLPPQEPRRFPRIPIGRLRDAPAPPLVLRAGGTGKRQRSALEDGIEGLHGPSTEETGVTESC